MNEVLFSLKVIKRLSVCGCISTMLLIGCISTMLLIGCNSGKFEDPIVENAKFESTMSSTVEVRDYSRRPPIYNAQVLFSEKANLLSGWNHVDNHPDEFRDLKFPSDTYSINRKPILNKGVTQYSTTLIKKFGDWNHQHSNGITALFSELSFSQVIGLELVLRIDSEVSHLPNTKEISHTYQTLVDNALLAKLDDGNVHLSLALRSESSEDIGTPRFHAEYQLSLDAIKQVNHWYHVLIPVAELTLYNEINYNQLPLHADETKLMTVSDFRLTAETLNTKVIRNYISDSFDDSVPKLFKEIGIEIRYIGVVNK